MLLILQTLISILLIGERSYYNDIYLCSLIWENNYLKIKKKLKTK